MLNAEREREMIMKAKGKGKSRKGKGKLVSRLAILCVLLFAVNMGVSFAKYYNNNYVANGKQLFGDKYIADDEYLNMTTIVGYETSDNGVLLLTNDGNGYYIEK